MKHKLESLSTAHTTEYTLKFGILTNKNKPKFIGQITSSMGDDLIMTCFKIFQDLVT